jgi:linoleoyl-CoA desaturase
MKIPVVKFSRDNSGFGKALRERVEQYFAETGKRKTGGFKMHFKTLLMLSLYFIPWGLITFGGIGGTAGFWIAEILMGFGLAGIGLNIMHDGNHNSYSSKAWVNKLMGRTVDLVGGNAEMWKIQHNVLHHTFTNIDGIDEDIDPMSLLRFNPNKPLYKVHKYQYIYAWFFYSLMTIFWMLPKDWMSLSRYHKKDLIKTTGRTTTGLLLHMIGTKAVYFTYILALPMMFSTASWWAVILGWVVMHQVAGFLMAIIFQPAHVLEHNIFPTVEDNSLELDSTRLEHQLLSSANYGTKNKFLTYCCGGLNFQIEHHLFPNICHVHYKALSDIVEKTADEFNLPYRGEFTFTDALRLHTQTLKNLGRPEASVVI